MEKCDNAIEANCSLADVERSFFESPRNNPANYLEWGLQYTTNEL